VKHHPLWSHSLAERLAMLKPGTLRVAYLAPKPDFGTFRYRCVNPVEALNTHSEDISASYFFYSDLTIIDDLSDYADVLVAVRTPYDARLDQLFRRFFNRDKRVFFDIDDLIFDTRFAPLVASNLGYLIEDEDLNDWTAFISNIGAAMGMASGVTTTNTFLAERIRDVVTVPVYLVPNTFNAAQADASLSTTKGSEAQHPGFRIGYFSGSHSHSQDFDIASGPLADFLRRSPESSLLIVGHLEVPEVFRASESRISRLPFMDFVAMQKVLASVDLNIVPLQSSAFTHSKSELKFFEAALVGTPTLASATPVFVGAIEDGVTGFLTQSAGWDDALSSIEKLGKSKLEKIGEVAKARALSAYSPRVLAESLAHIFGKTL
jgi:glycosyltransferase involved in cell wall biosynthesis